MTLGRATEARSAAGFSAPALDGVRGVAFLVVFLSHVPGLWMFPGGFGVTVFFFLSGYLITTLLRLEHAATGRIDFRRFFWRRFLRILPPYYLTLLVLVGAVALGAYGDAPVLWQGLLAQVGFLANYWVAAFGDRGLVPGSEVYWSLAVEEHFYLLFPFVAAALLARRGPRATGLVLLAVCAAVLAWRFALVASLAPHAVGRIAYATDTRLDSILFGAVVALALNPVLDPPGRLLRAVSSPWASALALAGIVATLLPRDPALRETVRYSAQGLLLVPLYCGILARPDAWTARALAHPWLRWLGALSYTLYLVHDAVIRLAWTHLRGLTPLWGIAALSFVVSVLYAEGVRRWLETPLARLRASSRAVPAADRG